MRTSLGNLPHSDQSMGRLKLAWPVGSLLPATGEGKEPVSADFEVHGCVVR